MKEESHPWRSMTGGRLPANPPSSRPVTIQVPLPVLGVMNGVREAFHGLCIATGLQVLEAMMEADREVLCGPKGRPQVERPAWRGGSVDSQVTLGGRQVELPRLRVRSADGEVPLASFQWAAATDPLDEHTLAAVAAGVSTRRYASTLDPVSRPATGRAGPAGGLHRRQGLPGPLHGDRAGGDTQGRKHVLGLREGATETAAVTPVCSATCDARTADGPDLAVRYRWRSGAAPGHHRCLRFSRRGATLPSPQVEERHRPSARAAARLCWQGVAGCVEPRFGGPRGAGGAFPISRSSV